jgi:ketosteroid isomerase-like protein
MSRENVELVRALWANLKRDPGEPWPPSSRDELDRRLRLDLCDESIEIRNPPEFPVADEYHGHDGVRQWATEVWEVFSEVHHDLEELVEANDGETVVSVQRTKGRMRHTGIETDLLWAAVWTVRDGKALRGQGYMTKEEALEAVGLRE